MIGDKKFLKDHDGNRVIPFTEEEAVLMPDGKTLKDKICDIDNKINSLDVNKSAIGHNHSVFEIKGFQYSRKYTITTSKQEKGLYYEEITIPVEVGSVTSMNFLVKDIAGEEGFCPITIKQGNTIRVWNDRIETLYITVFPMLEKIEVI